MLYKKVHRQYLRQFRIGRRFKFSNGNAIYCGTRFVSKLFIGKEYICMDYDAGYIQGLISMDGRILSRNNMTWLD